MADSLPQDRRLDRRAFLARMSVAASAALVAPGLTSALAAGPGHLARSRPAQDVVAAVRGASNIATPSTDTARTTGVAGTRPFDHPHAFARHVRAAAFADPAELTVAEAATLIRGGRLSPLELAEAYLARIDRYEPVYLAYNTVPVEVVRAEARRLTGSAHRGPLHGVPIAIKDNFYTAGITTTANSFIFQDFIPEFDATCVARLRAAGAVVLGKTQMGPLATTRATTPTGDVTTLNAWAPGDPSVSPGGSSSGSATAVAARMAASSTGTQTGGSITVPANAQGLTGLKPTVGRASLYGVIPLTYTRDHPGPIARDVKDAAILLAAMAGPDPMDPRTLGLPPVPDLITAAEPVHRNGQVRLRWPTRIGVAPEYADGSGPRADARSAMLATFEALGAELVEVAWPEDWDTLTSRAFNDVRLPERTEPFLEHLTSDVRLFGVSLPAWINGLLLGGEEYLKGQRARLLLLRRILEDLFADCDAIALPDFLPFDMVGLPLIAFPIGMGPAEAEPDEGPRPAGERGQAEGERPRPVEERPQEADHRAGEQHPRREAHQAARPDLPIGAILGGLPFGEDRLLSLVAAYQAVTEWHLRRPPDPDEEPPVGRGRIRGEDVPWLAE